jgi:hypothetical protein
MSQLLCRCPDAWQKYKLALTQGRRPPLEGITSQFVEFLNAYSAINSNDETVAVYWLIDRIDTIFWRTDSSSLGLLGGPPQLGDLNESKRKQIARALSTLEDLLGHLNLMSRHIHRTTGNVQLCEKKWEPKVKVLVSSHYESSALRGSHGGDGDIVWGLGKWIDLVV